MVWEFKKDGGTKLVSEEFVAKQLIDMGWTCEEYGSGPDLKKEAKDLGIKGAHLMKPETLKAKIEEAKADDDSE